jgi:hypothetical protein
MRALLATFLLTGCATVDPTCDADTKKCDGLCVDLQTSPQNCGDCGTFCGEGEVCV